MQVHGNRIEHNAEGGLVVCEGSQAEVLANSVASNQGAGVVVRGHNTRCCNLTSLLLLARASSCAVVLVAA